MFNGGSFTSFDEPSAFHSQFFWTFTLQPRIKHSRTSNGNCLLCLGLWISLHHVQYTVNFAFNYRTEGMQIFPGDSQLHVHIEFVALLASIGYAMPFCTWEILWTKTFTHTRPTSLNLLRLLTLAWKSTRMTIFLAMGRLVSFGRSDIKISSAKGQEPLVNSQAAQLVNTVVELLNVSWTTTFSFSLFGPTSFVSYTILTCDTLSGWHLEVWGAMDLENLLIKHGLQKDSLWLLTFSIFFNWWCFTLESNIQSSILLSRISTSRVLMRWWPHVASRLRPQLRMPLLHLVFTTMSSWGVFTNTWRWLGSFSGHWVSSTLERFVCSYPCIINCF